MKQMKRITLRLSLENPTDKKIADFLANIDKNKYHTVNNAIKTILYSVINGNATEKSEKSEMKEIINVIRTTLENEIPKMFSVFASKIMTKRIRTILLLQKWLIPLTMMISTWIYRRLML